MPAIQPARLKIQIEQVMEVFHRPDLFARSANELLEQYANRTQRPGQAEVGRSLLPVYNTPMPVLQTLLVAYRALAAANPDTGLAGCEALWSFQVVEPRLLAAQMLGALPTSQSNRTALLACLERWSRDLEDDNLRKRVILAGLARLGAEQPRLSLEFITEVLARGSNLDIKIGLTFLLALVENPEFQNLPVVFNLVSPAIRMPNKACKKQFLDLMTALSRRSPQESAYVFEQAVLISKNAETHWLVRQILEELPPTLADRLINLTHSSRSV